MSDEKKVMRMGRAARVEGGEDKDVGFRCDQHQPTLTSLLFPNSTPAGG
jgi:hypothetical protein